MQHVLNEDNPKTIKKTFSVQFSFFIDASQSLSILNTFKHRFFHLHQN